MNICKYYTVRRLISYTPNTERMYKTIAFITDEIVFLNYCYSNVSDVFWSKKTVKDVDIISNINWC